MTAMYLPILVFLISHVTNGLPLHKQDSIESVNDVTSKEDECGGLGCEEWATVREKIALLNALEAKSVGNLLESYSHDVPDASGADEDNEGPDILYTPEQIDEELKEVMHQMKLGQGHREKRKVISRESYRWELPIRYMINKAIGNHHKSMIRKAVKHWEERTCISFVEVKNAPDFKHIVFTPSYSGCASYVGNVNLGSNKLAQPIYLPANCFSQFGTPVHEIGHALGLYHEHQRPLREDHVTVRKENIFSRWLANFQAKSSSLVEDYDIPYDYNSVMHYGGKQGSSNGGYTLETTNELFQGNIGQRVGLSFLDAKAINRAYCADICEASQLGMPCQRGGYQDPKDCTRCRCPPGLRGRYCEEVAPPVGVLNCGDDVTLQSGAEMTIKSPYYDSVFNRYDNFMECNWLIKAPQGSHVEVSFEGEFAVYGTSKGICQHWVEIRHNDDFGKPGPRFCGNKLPTAKVTSGENEVLMTFRSNFEIKHSVDRTRGFKVKVRAVGDDIGTENTNERQPATTTEATTTTTSTTTTTTPTTTTTTPTTTPTTTTTTTTTDPTTSTTSTPSTTESTSESETWGEWSRCHGASYNCGCGGCAVRTRVRYCDGQKCGEQTETCSQVCVPGRDTYSVYIGRLYTHDCPTCCPGFHKVGDVCKKNASS